MINLVKGEKADLTKAAGGVLNLVTVGLGWDVRKTDGPDYDLDASVIVLNQNGRCISPEWFVYYNNPNSPNNEIIHHGDNLTGTGEGDDEKITISLDQLPPEATEIIIAVTIYDAKARNNQTFGSVEKAFVRVVNGHNSVELARFDITEDTEPGVNSLVFGKLYRKDNGWSFRAIGDGFKQELQGLVTAYKIG